MDSSPVYRATVDVAVSCAEPSVDRIHASTFERQWAQAGSYLIGGGTIALVRRRLVWKGPVRLERFYVPWSGEETPVTPAISTGASALMFAIRMCWRIPPRYTLEGTIEAKARWDGVTERGEYVHLYKNGEWTSEYHWPSERAS